MAESCKSIFRQRYCERLYKIGKYSYENRLYLEEFAGDFIKEETICTCDIEIPMLEPGEHFFLSDTEKDILITLRMRSSDGTIVYYTKDELISTENTVKSLNKCNEIASRYEELQKEYDEYRETYKYKHRWFNFTK